MGVLERGLEVLAGLFIVGVLLVDVFKSVILPRGANFRLRPSAFSTRLFWRVWRYRVALLSDPLKRENYLATFAPLQICWLLAMWIVGLIIGYGTILFGLREQLHPASGFFDTVYFAGTSLLTIGFGDITPAGTVARFVSLMAGASGFGVVAVCTTFLFQTVSAFQAREVFVTRTATRAGAPASGVSLLETYGRLNIADQLEGFFSDAETWCAQLLDSHIAYPILTYFRSSHDYESWVGTLGALLDATTLAITAVQGLPHGRAKLFNLLGRHAVHDLADYFGFEEFSGPGIERAEFDLACARLQDSGYSLRDANEAWERFSTIREGYAGSLNAMARWWNIPPSQWIGDRSLLRIAPQDFHGKRTEPEAVPGEVPVMATPGYVSAESSRL